MTVVLVCRTPREQLLTECGAKYDYAWRGGIQEVINNSAQLRGNRRKVQARDIGEGSRNRLSARNFLCYAQLETAERSPNNYNSEQN
ncbi:hypothetical protein M513_12438 [Trichuris suis]|uniref:Uncharacterized protein n=1 Tax=Trichuris suis TaxID=68888 RepID=A0A085LNX4_9BILA|nr:hypothetical protein M513_12438 [Trichuris suis]